MLLNVAAHTLICYYTKNREREKAKKVKKKGLVIKGDCFIIRREYLDVANHKQKKEISSTIHAKMTLSQI